MKRTTLSLTILLIITMTLAQTPQAFKYQAIVRNTEGSIIKNQLIAFRIGILQGGVTGTIVYQERQLVMTNNYGIANLDVGKGNIIYGTFIGIPWNFGQMAIKIEIDANGGTNYINMGTSEILAVPYAFYSETTGDTSEWKKNYNELYYKKGSVGIGTENIDSSAILQLESYNKGFLMPCLTTLQISVIDNPTDGLQVYNTTEGKLYIYVAQANRWKEIAFGNGIIIPTDTCGIITDERDGQVYNTVKIGEQCWMASNLNVGEEIYSNDTVGNNGIIEKYCYDNSTYNCEIYGGLYPWNEMMQYTTLQGTKGICPDGWHIPSEEEWTQLVDFAGGYSTAGIKLKSYGTIAAGTGLWSMYGGNNETGFTAFPGGYFYLNFMTKGTRAWFWTSTETEASKAYPINLFDEVSAVGNSSILKTRNFSVRCLRD